jgi:hypothetical protein
MTGKDAYWDDLGIAWRASAPDAALAAERLGARLKRQDALARIGAVIGLVAGALGLALGAWTAWAGVGGHAWNFVTRGISIAAVAVVALLAAGALAGGRGSQGSLREMLGLSGQRAERQARAAGLGIIALAILTVGGLIGYAIRVQNGHPPRMSPLEPILALALLAMALLWIRSSQARAARTCRRVAEALALDEA